MIKIIDYKAGNAPSVMHAIAKLGYKAEFAVTGKDLAGADHIILPGVGSAGATMESLDKQGFVEALDKAVLLDKTPFLGICVGLQVLFDYSHEDGAKCLGWFGGEVIKFDNKDVRVPQMGWNRVEFLQDTPIRAKDDYFYFVNSYHAVPIDRSIVWGTAEHGSEFVAAVAHKNIFAMQFHVEKSGEAGLRLLKEFLSVEGVTKC